MANRGTGVLLQIAVVVLWMMARSIPASAQIVFKATHLNMEDGLSHRYTMEVAQDSQGFIWVAAFDGLNRYDGHRFHNYYPQKQPELGLKPRDHHLLHLAAAGKDALWVGTDNGKMLLFRPGTGRFELLEVLGDRPPGLFAEALYTTRNKRVWAVLKGKIPRQHWLARPAQGAQGIVLVIPVDCRAQPRLLNEDRHDNLWFWTDQTFIQFNPGTATLTRYEFRTLSGSDAGKPNIPIDKNGRLWYPDMAGNLQNFPLPPGVALNDWDYFRPDNVGNLWLGTRDKKMYRLDTGAKKLEFVGKFDFWDYALGDPCMDREGNVWLPHFYGLTKLSQQQRLFENFLNQPLRESGASTGGQSIYRLFETTDGRALIEGTGRNYFLFNADSREIRQLPQKTPDTINHIHARLQSAVILLKIKGFQDIPNFPYCFAEQEKALWLSHSIDSGVYRIPFGEDQYRFFPFSGEHMNVLAIVCQSRVVWIGTDRGLYRLEPETGNYQHFSTSDGLPDRTVYSILPDGDYVWLGTSNGLCRFHPETGKTRNFFVEHGLTHNEFNRFSVLKTRDGVLYFGGLNGLNVLYPGVLEKADNRFRAQLRFTEFNRVDVRRDSLFVQDFSRAEVLPTLYLNPGDRSFTFRFFIDSYTKLSKNKYWYYLDSWERPWATQTSDGEATYLHLPAGHYTFRVKAADPWGNVAANEIAVPVFMPRVWYLRWWAWLIYAVALLSSGFLLYRIRLRQHLEHQEALRLQELDEVKTKLYTNITHEFRTPLTVILGMTGQVMDDQQTDKSRDKLQIIQRNGENLLQLVNQMLDLAKLESGKLSLHLVQADIVQYLRYVAGSFHSFAAHKDIELHFLSHTEQFLMDFDKDRVLHILSNLLSNAVKFTDSGGHIYLQTALEGERFLITVKDTGIGIPADKLPHIFDRFYQVDDSRTRRGEGTGIGLTLVHELLRLMNGAIGVQSQPGKGSEFSVSLPVTQKAPPDDERPGESPLRGHVLLPSAATTVSAGEADEASDLPLLLAVEDNADVAEYIRSCLDGQFRIVHAADGEAGIEKALAEIPDLIVSDVMMPVKDGFELVQTLKQDTRTNHIPIVLLTAKADITSKLEGLERGADAYLPKPFHPKELQLVLRNLLEQRRRLQEKYAGQDFSVPAPAAPAAPDPNDLFLEQATRAILARLDDALFGNEQLSREMTMSESQLNRKIKALTGQTLSLFIRSARLREGRKLLASTNLTVSEIAYAVGFTDPAYFSRTFSAEFGKAPSALRS